MRRRRPDWKEFYHIGRDSWRDDDYHTNAEGGRYFIPNIWPGEPKGFREAAEPLHYAEMEKLVGCS